MPQPWKLCSCRDLRWVCRMWTRLSRCPSTQPPAELSADIPSVALTEKPTTPQHTPRVDLRSWGRGDQPGHLFSAVGRASRKRVGDAGGCPSWSDLGHSWARVSCVPSCPLCGKGSTRFPKVRGLSPHPFRHGQPSPLSGVLT